MIFYQFFLMIATPKIETTTTNTDAIPVMPPHPEVLVLSGVVVEGAVVTAGAFVVVSAGVFTDSGAFSVVVTSSVVSSGAVGSLLG